MKQTVVPSPSGRSVARLRRYAVLALCVALLTLAVVSSLAQRRKAIRVPRGAAAESPRRELERESPRGRAEERRREDARARGRVRAMAARLKARPQDGVVGPGGISRGEGGVPTEGERGGGQTTEAITAPQPAAPIARAHGAHDPPAVHPPHLPRRDARRPRRLPARLDGRGRPHAVRRLRQRPPT